MVQTVTRAGCEDVEWSQRGISFHLVADEDAFIVGQRILFENKDYLVVSCGFERVAFGVVRWHVELE